MVLQGIDASLENFLLDHTKLLGWSCQLSKPSPALCPTRKALAKMLGWRCIPAAHL